MKIFLDFSFCLLKVLKRWKFIVYFTADENELSRTSTTIWQITNWKTLPTKWTQIWIMLRGGNQLDTQFFDKDTAKSTSSFYFSSFVCPFSYMCKVISLIKWKLFIVYCENKSCWPLNKREKNVEGKVLRFWLLHRREHQLKLEKQKVKTWKFETEIERHNIVRKGSRETCVKPKREFRKCSKSFEIVLFFRSFLLSDIFCLVDCQRTRVQ